MRIFFRPEARNEILEARAWYESRSPGLGLEFARAVDAALASVVRNPAACTQVEGECRRVTLRRFPYSIIYRAGTDRLLVVSVFHQHRKPGAWFGRIGG
jgi:plasmid stabilization system protein ParE